MSPHAEAAAERILLAIAAAHVVAGVAFAALPLAPSGHSRLVAAIFGERKTTEEVLFLVSAFGPTVASWGVLFYALVRAFFRNPASGTWWALVLAVGIWAPLDSALCIHYELYPAVAANTLIAAVFLVLLLRVRGLTYGVL
jgi:hypothetical protein